MKVIKSAYNKFKEIEEEIVETENSIDEMELQQELISCSIENLKNEVESNPLSTKDMNVDKVMTSTIIPQCDFNYRKYRKFSSCSKICIRKIHG